MDQFKDLVGDMPATDVRVGYEPPTPATPPPIIEGVPFKKRYPDRQKQA
jgi:hypothetical protein